MIKEGRKAPDFELPATGGEPVRLSALRGQTVVLYFYPRDNTPGCTREACAFQASMAKLRSAGAVVLGVSPDSLESHAKFRKEHGLRFDLLSDPDKKVATKYGAWGEKLMYGKKVTGMIRSTFLIDAGGTVRKVFPRVRVDGHADQVLAALKEL
jgi:peroxiredoxin Q/BCP